MLWTLEISLRSQHQVFVCSVVALHMPRWLAVKYLDHSQYLVTPANSLPQCT